LYDSDYEKLDDDLRKRMVDIMGRTMLPIVIDRIEAALPKD